MIPIASDQDYAQTKEYAAVLQRTLEGMRDSMTPTQYELASKGFLKELAQAQRGIAMYLAVPASRG